jgi:hypothetical protein
VGITSPERRANAAASLREVHDQEVEGQHPSAQERASDGLALDRLSADDRPVERGGGDAPLVARNFRSRYGTPFEASGQGLSVT